MSVVDEQPGKPRSPETTIFLGALASQRLARLGVWTWLDALHQDMQANFATADVTRHNGIEGMGRRPGPTTSYYRAVAGRAALCRAAQAEHEHKHKHEHKTARYAHGCGRARHVPPELLRPGVNFLASREAIGWAAASLRRTTHSKHQVDGVWFVCPIVGPWAEGSNGRSGRRNGVSVRSAELVAGTSSPTPPSPLHPLPDTMLLALPVARRRALSRQSQSQSSSKQGPEPARRWDILMRGGRSQLGVKPEATYQQWVAANGPSAVVVPCVVPWLRQGTTLILGLVENRIAVEAEKASERYRLARPAPAADGKKQINHEKGGGGTDPQARGVVLEVATPARAHGSCRPGPALARALGDKDESPVVVNCDSDDAYAGRRMQFVTRAYEYPPGVRRLGIEASWIQVPSCGSNC
ncbi:hypothetical protein BKA56DRAFT_614352 [Ilyonectria sp. MPI-CAGE-AT-0026]|nr:hypothetical protein BKA56DRAFT_614352 [Ilyonectria sp. MPI-CAGE-AT-0026]